MAITVEMVSAMPGRGGGGAEMAVPAPASHSTLSRLPPVMGRSPGSTPRRMTAPAPVPETPSSTGQFDRMLRDAAKMAAQGQGKSQGSGAGQGSGYGAGRGRGGDVRDIIRAQVLRHWNFRVAALAGIRRVISIRVVVDQDGQVEQADLRLDPALSTDKAYGELARSVRNAVLVSSPLHLPTGLAADQRDVVVDFDSTLLLR